jgi:uncharacterized protein YodC (DUF2158 family)
LTQAATFKTGDIVRLVSGGPAMTISEVAHNYIAVDWFEDGKLKSHSFSPAQLVLLPVAEMTSEQLQIIANRGNQ